MANSILALPPAAALDQALTELTAQHGSNVSTVKALRKARYYLGCGLEIVTTDRAFLIPSGTRANVVHEVAFTGECSCEAHGTCWHQQAIALVERAQKYTIPMGARIAARRAVSYEQAKREIDELWA